MMMYPEGTEGAKTVSRNKHSVFGGQKGQSGGGVGDGVGEVSGSICGLDKELLLCFKAISKLQMV